MKQPHQYRPLEQQPQHDACGIGAVVNISGQRTHETLDGALKIVEKLAHRTGKDADGTTGDGVGVMTQLPHALFQKAAQQAGQTLPDAGDYGAAMIFFPQDPLKRMRSRKLLEMILSREGLELLFWRDVPVCPEILSEKARSSMPYIAQCFIRRPDTAARGLDFDRRLYLARREYEHSVSGTYVVSMSSRTIVYKGLFLVWQLRSFYPDLQDADYTSALALVHSRFSTNTTPSWKRAHPNRIILHNGEINTIRGNINRMLAREETMASSVLGDTIARAYPVVETDGSDSSMLDNTLEFLMYSGIELPKAVMLCIPEPWGKDKNMSREKRDMFHYYATMMEPWDGPAAILFSDGEQVGAVLDRNGLRPARYLVTNDGYLILASEVGALPVAPEKIVRKSRLQPGKMLLVDTRTGTVLEDAAIKHRYAAQNPYGEWLDQELRAAGRYPHPQPEGPGIHGAGAQPPVQDLRLHLRRDPLGHFAHGEKRRGADGLHGRGYPAGRAVGKAPAAVLLLQADVRAGHEPAHRRAARGDRHRYDRLRRLRRQSAGRLRGKLPRPADQQPRPFQPRSHED